MTPPLEPRLTDRERDVLTLAAEGLSTTEIAVRLHISYTAASKAFTAILSVYGVPNRTAAVAAALRRGDIR